MRLERQTIKELKQEAATLCLDTSKCTEKKDLVDLIVHKKKSPSSEKDGKYSESNSKESSPYTIEKRTSRCHESEWFDCNLTDVENLRYDIDGTCIYQLKLDMTQHMRSTLDGRPWKTWVTSSRKGVDSIRRKASCLGSFQCVNENCALLKYYSKQNKLQFNPTNQACSVCRREGDYNALLAIKIWKFDDDSCHVKVFHNGYHTCEARKPFKHTEEMNKKLSQDRCTVTRATEDTIIDCLKEDERSWQNVFNIADSTLEREKLYYAKKKAKAENQQYEHSLEPVVALRSKLFVRDPFHIFRLYDKNMNGKPTFVLRSSQIQIQLVKEMDRDGTGFLNGEYCLPMEHLIDATGLPPYLYMFMLVFY